VITWREKLKGPEQDRRRSVPFNPPASQIVAFRKPLNINWQEERNGLDWSNQTSLRKGLLMKSVGSYEAKTHLPHLLSQVEKGETITITKHGKPIAVLSPAQQAPPQDVRVIIEKFRAYSKQQARTRKPLSSREIKEMIEEGRP
jgi:prevent-host-death family protein